MRSFPTSSSRSDVTADVPMLVLIFTLATCPDRHRLECAGQVMHIRRNDEVARLGTGDFVANDCGVELFTAGNELHRGRDFCLRRGGRHLRSGLHV